MKKRKQLRSYRELYDLIIVRLFVAQEAFLWNKVSPPAVKSLRDECVKKLINSIDSK